MISRTTLKHHANLMDDAASKVGIDLQDAALRGALRFDDISDAVLRCTACTNPAGCAKWLAADSDLAPQLPQYCENKSTFEGLKR